VSDEDAPRVPLDAEQLRTLAEKLVAAAAGYNENRASIEKMAAHFDTLSANITMFRETVRVGVMERLDRQQDDYTKLKLELEAAVQLLRDSAPTQLLVRIVQLQDEVRELKEAKV
jgi:hypothetical protein